MSEDALVYTPVAIGAAAIGGIAYGVYSGNTAVLVGSAIVGTVAVGFGLWVMSLFNTDV